MVALSSSVSASSASVLNLSAPTGRETSSFLSSTSAPKDTTELVTKTINSNPAAINNLTANVAAPAVANLLQPSDVEVTSLIATSLNSTTSVDALVKSSNDAAGGLVSKITSQPISNAPVQSLKDALPVPAQSDGSNSTTNTSSTESITVTSNTAEKKAVATATAAYTTTANYGQSGSGGSGTFSLSL